MSDIALSRGIRSNLLTLQNIADGRQTIQGRLATGKKVNSALDNPTNFFTAQGLNNRAADLTGLLDGMSNSVQTLQAADKGIKAITNLLNSAQAKLKEGLQNVAATAGTASATFAASASIQTIAMTVNGAAMTVAGTFASVNDAVTAINAALGTNGNVSANGTNGLIVSNNGTSQSLTVAGGAAAAASKDYSKYAEQFNELLRQVDGIAKDSSFNGKNLLYGDDISVILNEKTGGNQSKLDVKGTVFDSNGLGLSNIATGAKAASATNMSDGLDKLQTALNTLREQSSKFGSNLSVVQTRQDFTKELNNVLKTGADNLTLADQNEEGANLLALNTRAQLATSAMSFASQADQQVLQFLR